MENPPEKDRREHMRFAANSRAFAVYRFRVGAGREVREAVGQILDINLQGLAFRTFVQLDPGTSIQELSIMLPGAEFTISGIPIRTITELEIPNSVPLSSTIQKRYGVRFEKLTSEQTALLEQFIRMHTSGQV